MHYIVTNIGSFTKKIFVNFAFFFGIFCFFCCGEIFFIYR